MKLKHLLLIFLFVPLLFIGTKAKAQAQIEVSGVITPGTLGAADTITVYLESLTGVNIPVRSVTLSLLYNASCATYTGNNYSLFRQIWPGPFERIQVLSQSLPTTQGGYTYNRRLGYTNITSSVPPSLVQVPPTVTGRIKVLSFTFSGVCASNLQLEDVLSFPANMIGDISNNPIPFRVAQSNQLPVEYVSMDAQVAGENTAKITWATSIETNSAFFEIEKAFDADFASSITVGQVQAAIESNEVTHYSFTDQGNMAPRVYYRLRQVDLDGHVALTSAMEVNFSEGLPKFSLSGMYTLADDAFQLRIEKGNAQRFVIQVMDLNGRVLHTQEGGTELSAVERMTVSTAMLPKGCYLIQATEVAGNGGVHTIKMLK